MNERVDDQDYNNGAQNDHPIGNLNARYRCLPAKPFHDFPPRFQRRLTKDEARPMAVNFAGILPRRPRPAALVAARARPLWDRKRSSFACHSNVARWNWCGAKSAYSERRALRSESVMANKVKEIPFDPMVFLATVDGGRTISKYRKNEMIFRQGDPADPV
jgi:hypothetical protein